MIRRTLAIGGLLAVAASAQLGPGKWRTDVSKHSIRLNELQSGGPGKDGIVALRDPRFVPVDAARKWLEAREPVIVVEIGGEVRAYPLQILLWHELVNDRVGETPILVSYCPLCNSAVVFDRRVRATTYEFGVSGMLRDSDMVMFDRETESLWQQITGEAIVGSLTGSQLAIVASQTVSFEMLAEQFPQALVLSRDTGYSRRYSENPYVGYEFAGRLMFPVRRTARTKVASLDRLVAVTGGGHTKAYTFSVLRRIRVLEDELGDMRYVVFFDGRVRSALDEERTRDSRQVGTVGVFSPELDGRKLTFQSLNETIRDQETGSSWNVMGMATAGPLLGGKLRPVQHTVAFAFAWLVFKPDTEVANFDGRPKNIVAQPR